MIAIRQNISIPARSRLNKLKLEPLKEAGCCGWEVQVSRRNKAKTAQSNDIFMARAIYSFWSFQIQN